MFMKKHPADVSRGNFSMVILPKRTTTRNNDDVQSVDQEKAIIANSGAYTLKDEKIIKKPIYKGNVATIINK